MLLSLIVPRRDGGAGVNNAAAAERLRLKVPYKRWLAENSRHGGALRASLAPALALLSKLQYVASQRAIKGVPSAALARASVAA